MNHVKNFKLFEKYQGKYDEWDLACKLTQKEIEDYYQENYDIDIETICEIDPNFIWNNIDEYNFIENFIKDRVKEVSPTLNIDIEIYKEFFDIKKNQKIILDYYNNRERKYSKYEYGILSEISKGEFVKLIEKLKKEDELYTCYYEDKYWNKTPNEIVELEFSTKDIDIYDLTFHFIDDTKVIESFLEHQILFDTKIEYVAEEIPYSLGLQKLILDKDQHNVLLLFDVMNDEDYHFYFAGDYDFQKAYIKEYVKENGVGKEPEALKNIQDSFGIINKIKSEYKNDLYLIDAEKYNL